MIPRKLAFIYSPAIETLKYPDHCPFKTQRAALTRYRLIDFGLLDPRKEEVDARRASPSELLQFHTEVYLDEMERAAEGQLSEEGIYMGFDGESAPVFRDMYNFGAWAAGSALTGADLLLQGRVDVAFSLLGGFHHAKVAKASGFCYVNDTVLACAHLAAGGQRVAYVDIDAHHGDGVQEAFYCRNDVLTISLHESGRTLFPWGGFEAEIGKGPGMGYNVNLPLPEGTYDGAYLGAFDRVVMPLLGAYRPDAIVLGLGMDLLASDPTSHLDLSNNVVAEVIDRVLDLGRPLLVLGGGGYDIENTVRGWALAWQRAGGAGGSASSETSGQAGRLRDPEWTVAGERRDAVMPQIETVIATVTRNVFGYHGLNRQVAMGDASLAQEALAIH